MTVRLVSPVPDRGELAVPLVSLASGRAEPAASLVSDRFVEERS
jgi:hypothetical protein